MAKLFNEEIILKLLTPTNSNISLDNKLRVINELRKLNFLENYQKLEIYKIEEKLK